MELDEETLDGHWSTNNNTGMDFFIINDAIFSKLCILGEDVEPCFEGSRITAPEVSTTFTKMDEDFKNTLFTMMKDLKHALEGGYKMELEDEKVETEVTTAIEEEVAPVETTEVETEATAEETVAEETISTENIENSIVAESNEEKEEEIVAEEEKEDESEDNDVDESEDKKDYSLVEQELEELKVSYAEMEKKYQELVTFKEAVDNEKKDALINSFYMLSDEDKKDVIENKSKYSLEDIEAKLSVICVRKKVNFDLEDTDKNEDTVEEEVITTYSLNEEASAVMPAWLKALKNTRDSNKE